MSKAFRAYLDDIKDTNILVVDAINLAFRYKHKKQLFFIDDYIQTIESLALSYKCGKIIVVCDKFGSDYRKNIYPEYKANRDELRKKQTEEEAEDFRLFFDEFENVLNSIEQTTPHLLLKYSGVEADDLAAYIVKKRKDFNIDNIWLASSDKDWDLLINHNVSRFSYVTRKETRIDNWSEIHGDIPMDQYISVKCLMGDKGDNIFGIPSIGPSRAVKLLEEYGTAYDVYSACPIDSKYVYIKNLNREYEKILLNYELMDLLTYCEDAIGPDNLIEINESVNRYLNGSL